MKDAVAPLLALLLAVSLSVGAVAATDPIDDGVAASTKPIETNETTNRLALEGDVQSGYAETGPDLATTLASQDDAMRVDRELFVVDETFATQTNDERRETLEAAYDRLRQRIDALEQRERTAVRRHTRGEISDGELVTVLLRNYREANELEDALVELEDRATRVPGYSISIDSDRGRLGTYQSPVRAQLDATTDGGVETIDGAVLVDTSQDGFIVSAMHGRVYLREATRFDNRDVTRPNQFQSISDAFEHAESQYPWAFDQPPGVGSRGATEFTAAQLYRIRAPTVHGDLEAYLDGGSKEVYREFQQLTIDELPATPENRTWTSDSLALSVNRTPVNGPVEITVVDRETDRPVDGTVTVDGYDVGRTGEDGTVWILPPAEDFDVAVRSADGNMDVSISSTYPDV